MAARNFCTGDLEYLAWGGADIMSGGINMATLELTLGREVLPNQVDIIHDWQGDEIADHANVVMAAVTQGS